MPNLPNDIYLAGLNLMPVPRNRTRPSDPDRILVPAAVQTQIDAELQLTALYYPELVHPAANVEPNPTVHQPEYRDRIHPEGSTGNTAAREEHFPHSAVNPTYHPYRNMPGMGETPQIGWAAGGGNPQVGNPGFAVGEQHMTMTEAALDYENRVIRQRVRRDRNNLAARMRRDRSDFDR